MDDGWLFSCFGSGVGDHVQHGMVRPCSHVEGLESISLKPDGEFDGADHVGHVGEVAALAAVSQNRDGAVLFDCSLEGFEGEVGSLSWSPDGEEPQGAHADVVLAGVEAAPMFAVELGERVGAAWVPLHHSLEAV